MFNCIFMLMGKRRCHHMPLFLPEGRAGRVSKGYCYRLVPKDFWDTSIPDHVIPEMLVNSPWPSA